MKKVVLNGCFGGFGLSALAVAKVLERKGFTPYVFERDWETDEETFVTNSENINPNNLFSVYTNIEKNGDCYGKYSFDFDRDDEDLVSVVEELGEKANSSSALLYIDEYDEENFDYDIDEYDGSESLILIPVVSEKRLSECKTTSEIVEYLQSLNITVKTL